MLMPSHTNEEYMFQIRSLSNIPNMVKIEQTFIFQYCYHGDIRVTLAHSLTDKHIRNVQVKLKVFISFKNPIIVDGNVKQKFIDIAPADVVEGELNGIVIH